MFPYSHSGGFKDLLLCIKCVCAFLPDLYKYNNSNACSDLPFIWHRTFSVGFFLGYDLSIIQHDNVAI